MKAPFTLPTIIGHRGVAALAPENTLPSFTLAAEHGLSFIELDAKLCASGEVVVLHDNTIQRTSNGHGRAGDMTLAQLRVYDFGAWFDQRFRGTRISTLADVLDQCVKLNIGVNVELKPNPDQYAATAKAVAELIARHHYHDKLPLLLSSFSLQCLRAIKKVAPHLARAVLLERRFDTMKALALLNELDAVSCNVDALLLDTKKIQTIKNAGFALMAWTVNDVTEAKRLKREGVDSFFSDYPLLLE